MKFKFPPPPNFHGDATGPEVPLRVTTLEIQYCDGAGVCVEFAYANGDGSTTERVALSLPAAVKLSNQLSDAVDGYLYETGEVVTDHENTEDES